MHKETETNVHLTDYVKILWRKKWIVIIFFMTIVSFVAIGTFFQKSTYKATASLIIEMKEPDILKFNDMTTLGVNHVNNYDRYLYTQTEIATSRQIANKVFDDLNLKKIFERREQNQEHLSTVERCFHVIMSPRLLAEKAGQLIRRFIPKDDESLTDEAVDIEYLKEYEDYYDTTDAYVYALMGKVEAEFVRDSQIMYIDAEDEDRHLATVLANKFASTFIEQNRDYRLKAFFEAQDLLTKEIVKQENNLKRAELHLQDFRELNNITSIDVDVPENSSDMVARIRATQLMKDRLTDLKIKLSEYENLYRDKNPKMIRLREQIAFAEKALEEEREKSLGLEKKAIEYTALKREVETTKNLYQVMLNRLSEISISSEFKVNNVRLKEAAAIPTSPIRPKKVLNILLSIFFGLFGGSLLAFLFNYMDRRIKDSITVEKDLGLHLLGAISVIKDYKWNGQSEKNKALYAMHYPMTHVTEGFRGVRTNIYFSLQGADTKKSIVFTSYGEGEGKTLISTNVSQVLSGGGSKTLLVDADFRRPQIHTFFDCDNKPGLSTFLQDKTDLDNIIQKTNLPNLYIVTSGIDETANGGNLFELLNSQRMWDFVRETEKTFDRIIYDLPPFGIINDAFILGSITKAVVLVIEYDKTNKENILHAKQLFEKLNIKITGAILNKCPMTKESYYYKYHGIRDGALRNVNDAKLVTHNTQQ